MDSELLIRKWVEYSICEYALEAYPKSKSNSLTFNSFCERLRESLVAGELSKWEYKTLAWIIYNTNRVYCFPVEEIDDILAGFFIERRWREYEKAIHLMKSVRYRI